MSCLGKLGFGLALVCLMIGCLGSQPHHGGYPCLKDSDCGGLFCKNFQCVAEPCVKASRACFAGNTGCKPDGEQFQCSSPCRSGTQTCKDGFWGACEGQLLPEVEVCNGKDDNCDGKTDESFPEQTTLCPFKNSQGVDIGAEGVMSCENGKLVCTIKNEVFIRASGHAGFKIGSPDTSGGHKEDEAQTAIQFNYDYSIQQTEVTQGEFRRLMGYNPSTTVSDQLPVSSVTWNEAALFANQLSQERGLQPCFDCSGTFTKGTRYTGDCTVASKFTDEDFYVRSCPGFRLPTEAEWEYAYRFGNNNYKSFHNDDIENTVDKCSGDAAKDKDIKLEQIGWYCANSQGKPQPVNKQSRNRWEIADMSGNVAEWVFDWYESRFSSSNENRVGPRKGTERVFRGGHYLSPPVDCRSSARFKAEPKTAQPTVGFRLARTLFEPKAK